MGVFKLNKVVFLQSDSYRINQIRLTNILNENEMIKNKYNLYISQFRSEKEGLYCLLHQDDISNHLCPICNNPCGFYVKKSYYNNTCCNIICTEKVCNSKEANEKRKNTNIEKYGVFYPIQSKDVRDKVEQSTLKNWGVKSIL